jgi:hypothetical protein
MRQFCPVQFRFPSNAAENSIIRVHIRTESLVYRQEHLFIYFESLGQQESFGFLGEGSVSRWRSVFVPAMQRAAGQRAAAAAFSLRAGVKPWRSVDSFGSCCCVGGTQRRTRQPTRPCCGPRNGAVAFAGANSRPLVLNSSSSLPFVRGSKHFSRWDVPRPWSF